MKIHHNDQVTFNSFEDAVTFIEDIQKKIKNKEFYIVIEEKGEEKLKRSISYQTYLKLSRAERERIENELQK